jgi:hypothetical protein
MAMLGIFYPPGSDNAYTVTRMSHDYKSGDALNEGSALVQNVNCLSAGGPTAYKQALVAAQDELVNHGSGRQGVQRVIVFETDGAANTVPLSYLTAGYQPAAGHADDVVRPCGSAADYVNNTVKPSGTVVFTVAYSLLADDDCYQAAHKNADGTSVGYRTLFGVREPIAAGPTLTSMASPGGAFSAAGQSDMTTAFQRVANKLLSARLVPDGEGT